jgi:MFS family permease
MLVVAPLTLLPWPVGLAVWLVLSTAAVVVALLLLEIRDWRVYAVAFASNAFLVGLIHGNVTLPLLLGLVAAWRWRDRPAVVGAAVAALIVAKLFLWPLLVWLLVTRRVRAAAYAAGMTVLVTIGAWAIIGFDGFRTYPQLLRALDHVYSPHSVSLTALGIGVGLSQRAAQLVALAVAVAVLAIGATLARQEDGDRRMYTAAVVAALIATPILWLYYFLLLLAPLVLYRPRSTLLLWAGSWTVSFVGAATAMSAPCCRPQSMPKSAWATLHTKPSLAVLFSSAAFLGVTAAIALRGRSGSPSRPQASPQRPPG